MNGIARVFLSAWIFLCISPLASADLEEAWEAWGDGDIEPVWGLVEEAGGSGGEEDGWRHLRFFVSCVSGRYEDALGVYDSISSDYSRLGELDGAYVDACGHLGRLDDAAAFAKRRGMADSTVAFLELQAAAPLRVTLEGVIVIPFADHPLTRYFPGFDAELNGESVVAHVDTGGTFLIMGPERAEILGIETVSAGKGFHGSNSVDMRVGISESFRLGDALLENVPVATLASLTGTQDFVIFGTNLL
ncbi:MAG TPA: hypothetical protein EYN96_06005, partial [Candidatus Hydrogenedentes bacterium]|nr:hypothetical protein [Candidatus Hydrogenedentota bacterium]